MFSTGFTSLSVLLLFPTSINFFVFVHGFDSISSNLDQVPSINPSAVVLFGDFTSIIRTGLPILVELIDLMNSVIIFLSQTTLLKWLAFLLVPRLWFSQSCSLGLFLSSDASICSTMVFPPLGNSDHALVSISIDFPSYSQPDAPFHHTAYDYSHGLHDPLRDVPWEDIFKLCCC